MSVSPPPYSPIGSSITDVCDTGVHKEPLTVQEQQYIEDYCLLNRGARVQRTSVLNVEESLTTPTYSYKLVGDNLDKNIKPRYMRYNRQKKSLHFFNVYAVQDRILQI